MPRATGAKAKPWAKSKAADRILTPDEEWAEELVARVLASCHPEQRAFVLDPAKRITALVGRGGGKTTAGAARFAIRMARTKNAKCLYVAPTKDAARDIIWNKLKDIFERLGCECDFHEVGLRIVMRRTGSELRLVGADNMSEVDKRRGVPYHEVGVDEAAAIRPNILEALVVRAISPRLGDYDGALWMISTPGHHLSGLFYEQSRTGSTTHRPYAKRDEFPGWASWSSHRWTLWSAAKHIPAISRLIAAAEVEKTNNGWTDDNPIWRREYLGEWAADDTNNVYQYKAHAADGTPWNEWDPARVGPMRLAKLPEGRNDWIHVLGADMGHSDPFSLHLFSASPSDPQRRIFHRYEFEKTKMYAKPIAELLLGEELDADKPGGLIGAIGEWPTAMVADMTHLGGAVLDELAHVYGVRFTAADQKEKFASIELMNGDLVDGRMKILKGSKLAEQMTNLQWQADEFGRLRENKGQPNHCFVAGTMVMTERGEVPIERVQRGDFVHTRNGLRMVTFSGMTGVRETVSVQLSNGRTLVGTPEHKVWTLEGWIDLALLTQDDTLVEWVSTVRPKSWCSRGSGTVGILTGPTRAWPAISAHPMGPSCTAQSGKPCADPSRPDSMSTTAMATAPTTGSGTSNRSTHESTSALTCANPSESRYLAVLCGTTLAQLLPSGTAQKRGARGTPRGPGPRTIHHDSSACVGYASGPTSPPSAHPSCAPSRAVPRTDETAGSTTSTSRAVNAASCSDGTATRRSDSARCHARSVTKTGRVEPVYDLSVDGDPEFFANGVLVHNSSDASIYARRALATLFANAAPADNGPRIPARRETPVERDELDPDETRDPNVFDDSGGREDFDDFDFAAI